MIPNDEQILAIKQYLKKHLKYRETKDELFDHVLTALEHVPEGVSFGEAMNAVIGDIGGLKGIASIEKAAKMSAIRALLKRYFETLKQIGTSYFILVAGALTILAFYLINKYFVSSFSFSITMMLMVNIPNLAIKRHVLKKPNLFNVKNDAFRTIYMASGMITPAMMFLSLPILYYGSTEFFLRVMPFIATATLGIAVLHGAVLYKLTRQEFRVKFYDIDLNHQ